MPWLIQTRPSAFGATCRMMRSRTRRVLFRVFFLLFERTGSCGCRPLSGRGNSLLRLHFPLLLFLAGSPGNRHRFCALRVLFARRCFGQKIKSESASSMSSEGALSASELPAGFSADSCAEDGPPSVGEDSFSPPRKLTRHWALRASRIRPPNPPRGGPRSAAVSSRFSSPECFPQGHLRAQPPAEGAQLLERVCLSLRSWSQNILTFGKNHGFSRSPLGSDIWEKGRLNTPKVCLFAHGLQYILTFGKKEARKFRKKLWIRQGLVVLPGTHRGKTVVKC